VRPKVGKKKKDKEEVSIFLKVNSEPSFHRASPRLAKVNLQEYASDPKVPKTEDDMCSYLWSSSGSLWSDLRFAAVFLFITLTSGEEKKD